MTTIALAMGFEGTLSRKVPPPTKDWHPRSCRGARMRIARDGARFHLGSPIMGRELVRLHSAVRRKDEDGFVRAASPVYDQPMGLSITYVGRPDLWNVFFFFFFAVEPA